ncbi:Myeloid cell surface antigen CD33 [Myotis davidii]|uniref:Myeloid cell surface antigen CD33 n=1 Tax=Myotis davidii TaxID=225400 RepID=L5MGL3_MYODS|nr:Myeloid cell surface antigen CD33 [Myotis davidii]
MLWLLPLLWAGSLAKDERYTLTVQTPVTVQEGLCVFVPCTFTHPWSYRNHPIDAYGYWFQERADKKRGAAVVTNNPSHKVQEETQGRFHLLGDPHTNNCSLDIRDAKRTDDGSYFFRMEKTSYPKDKYSYVESKLTVRVTALNHTPNILIWETLESGLPRNLTCSVPWACEWGTPPIFSWTSAAHSSLGPRTHLSSVLTLTPRPQDHGTNLTCQVHFPATGVTVETTIQLNVTSSKSDPVSKTLVSPNRVKTRRKKARTAMGMDNIHTAMGPASLGHQKTPQLDSPATDSTSSAGAAPTLRVEPEVCYASIRFQGKNRTQTSTESEYSNVRTQ